LAALALAALAVVFRWLERSGVSVGLWLGLFLGGCLVLTLILWVLHAYLKGRNALSTRMGRLIVEGRAAEAIELGEAVPPDARDAFVLHSLAAAYCESGDLDRAEALFTELRARPDLPAPLRKLLGGWMERIAQRRAAARAERNHETHEMHER
jgi:pentatricopeptide repeat protein